MTLKIAYSPSEAAEVLSIPETIITKALLAGHVRAVTCPDGGLPVITHTELETWASAWPAAASAEERKAEKRGLFR